MLSFRMKAAAAAVSAGAALSCLALPGQAYASSSSVGVSICDKYRAIDSVVIYGQNQDGQSVRAVLGALSNNCTAGYTERWKTGQKLQIELHWENTNYSTTYETCWISSTARNGGVLTCRYSY